MLEWLNDPYHLVGTIFGAAGLAPILYGFIAAFWED